jgi:hypothetical protein
MRRQTTRVALAVVLLALAVRGSAGAITGWPGNNLQPLVVGWEQFFRVQWDEARVNGQPIVQGYITNAWNFTARRVQLLVTGYDESGAQVGQLVAWGPSPITPGSRVYFDVGVPPAASYDVALFAWDWVQRDRQRRLLLP